jgi:HEAT repeat protein
VPVLVTALDSESAEAREQAALTLGRLGENARAAGAKLAERLELDGNVVKSAILFALGRIGGPDAARAIPALRRALENPDLRPVAAEALARIAGADAVDVVPILIEAVRSQSEGPCPHPTAHEALRTIGSAAVPAIVAALAEPEGGGGYWLFEVLDDLGREALEAARPILLSRLDTPGSDVEAAKRLLRLDGTPSAKLIEIFSHALASSNPWWRLEGAQGLVNAGPDHRARVEQVLVELLGHEYEEVRTRAAAALKRIRDARP